MQVKLFENLKNLSNNIAESKTFVKTDCAFKRRVKRSREGAW